MINSLRSIYIFTKAVQIGSFRGTAKTLDLSPSVVSYHITQLEKSLGTTLFYRSTRKLSLTHQGRKLFDAVKNMIDVAEAGFSELGDTALMQSGKLAITLPAAFSRGRLIADFADFARQNPKIEMAFNFTDSRQDLIAKGIDLAIRVGNLPDSALKSRKIIDIQRKLVASPGYIKQVVTPKSPRDLDKLNWIRFDATPAKRIFRHYKQGGQMVRFESKITVDSVDALCQFVKADLGLGTPPAFLVERELENGELVEVLPQWKIDPLAVYAVWPPNAARESLTSRLVDFLVSAAGNGSSR